MLLSRQPTGSPEVSVDIHRYQSAGGEEQNAGNPLGLNEGSL